MLEFVALAQQVDPDQCTALTIMLDEWPGPVDSRKRIVYAENIAAGDIAA